MPQPASPRAPAYRQVALKQNGKTIQLQTAEVGRLLLFGKTFHFLSSSAAGTSEI
jgi:hypothetical protein